MVNRILFALYACPAVAGFLTLTPPDEAIENLAKWWRFVTTGLARASGIDCDGGC